MMFLGYPSHEAHFEMATTLRRIRREAVGSKGEYDILRALETAYEDQESSRRRESNITRQNNMCHGVHMGA